jgi:hypothetical protein
MIEIGTIKYAKDLGFNDYSKRMWSACKSCGRERWATYEHGNVKEYCQPCAQRIGGKQRVSRGVYNQQTKVTSLCKVCNKEYPANKEYFCKSKSTKSGLLLGRCKRCVHRLARLRNKSTAHGRINLLISNHIRQSLHGSKRHIHWETLVGYTIKDLMKHLERKFKLGMTWENYGKWHIDHIMPKSVFKYESPDDIDFKRCWSLNNLQPLWSWENESKGAKIKDGFQPSLK